MTARIALWMMFILCSVYGHVALKLAARSTESAKTFRFWLSVAQDPWTVTAFIAWSTSAVLWVLLLQKTPLFEAMSISSLRYGLVILSAAVFLHESFGRRQAVGMALIACGIFLVKAK